MTESILTQNTLSDIADKIKDWSAELGFQQTGITGVELSKHEALLNSWLDKGFHGEMDYMQKHGVRRSRPAELEPGTLRVISVRMNYWPDATDVRQNLKDDERAYVSRYAVGRDYHKLMRKRLARLSKRIEALAAESRHRVFVDSAPVLERALAEQAGLGWIGKNTMLIHPKVGSYFFLGEIFTNLPLPTDDPFTGQHCGRCTACLDLCPTKAFPAPNVLDSRRCISYLTIELRGSIPEELRPLMGNRVFGCDDCQMVCPWNRFAEFTEEDDFSPRNQLDSASLIDLFSWSEEEFLKRTEGSAIRRAGHVGWLRNIAVGLGNAKPSAAVTAALKSRADHPSELVREHVQWALKTQSERSKQYVENAPYNDAAH